MIPAKMNTNEQTEVNDMWLTGIAAYPGLGDSDKMMNRYLRTARNLGYTILFTSLHIPEAKAAAADYLAFISGAAELGYAVTADISPRTFDVLGSSAAALHTLQTAGLSALRVDYGFSASEVARITITGGLTVELNASTVTPEWLDRLRQAGADFSRLQACHNYYPRPETGLSYTVFAERSQLLRHSGIPVFAFIPSLNNPRGPIHASLPTLERHRATGPVQAAKEFIASRLVDGVLFGDPLADDKELADVADLDPRCLELSVQPAKELTPAEQSLLYAVHTNRLDAAEQVIRSEEARSRCSAPIHPGGTGERPAGAVTIDNQLYGRYMGELQIVREPLPPDDRVNVVAHILPADMFLLRHIGPGTVFRLKEAVHEA